MKFLSLLRFLVRISLQRFCGSDFSSIKDFRVNTFSSEIFLDSESQSKKI